MRQNRFLRSECSGAVAGGSMSGGIEDVSRNALYDSMRVRYAVRHGR